MGVDTHGAYTGRRIKGTSLPLASKAIMRQLSIPKVRTKFKSKIGAVNFDF